MTKTLNKAESQVDKRGDFIETYITLKKKNISLLTFILQGYEGFAIATTIDKTRAIVKLFIMNDFIDEIENLLKSLNADLKTQEVCLSPD
jgi:hypothetical protein